MDNWHGGCIAFWQERVVNKMVRLNKVLDPTLTGRDAEELEAGLRRKIVGQDEAIEQIVNI